MVNTRIISRFQGPPPVPEQGEDRRIPGGPLYPKVDVLELLDREGAEAVKPLTDKCIREVADLAFDSEEIATLVRQAVTSGRFRNSEWCQLNSRQNTWAAADAYSLVRKEWMEAAYKDMDIEYYLKFAIGITGKLLILVSCHTSQNRN
jgi:hypothetical protein